jgi:molybdate transport system substrate-binding protein
MSTAISGISSMATRLLLAELARRWNSHGGATVTFESVGGIVAARRVVDGEPLDLVVLAADAIGDLAAAGRLMTDSATPLVYSPVGIAVRAGHPHPVIDSEASLRRAVLEARSVSYSTGPSGQALQRVFERWGIADDLRGRLVQPPPGTPVGALLARGDVELGFQQLSELMHLDGIDVLGPMPPGLEIVTTFSGAVCATSARPDVAHSFLDFACSPATAEAKRRHGMQPTRSQETSR